MMVYWVKNTSFGHF